MRSIYKHCARQIYAFSNGLKSVCSKDSLWEPDVQGLLLDSASVKLELEVKGQPVSIVYLPVCLSHDTSQFAQVSHSLPWNIPSEVCLTYYLNLLSSFLYSLPSVTYFPIVCFCFLLFETYLSSVRNGIPPPLCDVTAADKKSLTDRACWSQGTLFKFSFLL